MTFELPSGHKIRDLLLFLVYEITGEAGKEPGLDQLLHEHVLWSHLSGSIIGIFDHAHLRQPLIELCIQQKVNSVSKWTLNLTLYRPGPRESQFYNE
jgi:hypothetical protein